MAFPSQLGFINLGAWNLGETAVAGNVYTQTFDAALSFNGSLSEKKVPGQSFSAGLSFSGGLSQALVAGKTFDAALDFSGALGRSLVPGLADNFPAGLSFSGSLGIAVTRGGGETPPDTCSPFDVPATPAFLLTNEPEEQ